MMREPPLVAPWGSGLSKIRHSQMQDANAPPAELPTQIPPAGPPGARPPSCRVRNHADLITIRARHGLPGLRCSSTRYEKARFELPRHAQASCRPTWLRYNELWPRRIGSSASSPKRTVPLCFIGHTTPTGSGRECRLNGSARRRIAQREPKAFAKTRGITGAR
jgi:hypothetical protein